MLDGPTEFRYFGFGWSSGWGNKLVELNRPPGSSSHGCREDRGLTLRWAGPPPAWHLARRRSLSSPPRAKRHTGVGPSAQTLGGKPIRGDSRDEHPSKIWHRLVMSNLQNPRATMRCSMQTVFNIHVVGPAHSGHEDHCQCSGCEAFQTSSSTRPFGMCQIVGNTDANGEFETGSTVLGQRNCDIRRGTAVASLSSRSCFSRPPKPHSPTHGRRLRQRERRHRDCRLTLRWSRLAPAWRWPASRWSSSVLAGQAPSRRSRLNSNVRPRGLPERIRFRPS